MGYSYFCPSVVFGFRDDAHESGYILDREYIEEYGNILAYAAEINKGYNIDRVIGIPCAILMNRLDYGEDDYEDLMLLKKDYEAFHNKTVTLDYFAVISGDYEEEEETYTFAADDEESDTKEEE